MKTLTRLISNTRPSLIPTKKICKDCKHYIGDEIECGKFGTTDYVTGKITYHSARHTRADKDKCGEDAIHFDHNHYKLITVPYYFVRQSSILLLPIGTVSCFMFYIMTQR